MEENKINALMDMTVSKIRQLVDADTIIGKPISTPDGITVIPVSRMSFGIGTGGTTGSKGISFTGGNGAGVKVEPVGFFVIKDGTCRMISVNSSPLSTMDRVVEMMPDVLDRIDNIVNKKNKE
ncbi:MAG: GerW family sporulation protein [Oscillospiraceae bacterium]